MSGENKISITIENQQVTFSPELNWNGIETLTFTVHDLDDATSTESVNIIVSPVNDSPEFSLSGDITVDEDFDSAQSVSVIPGIIPEYEVSQTVVDNQCQINVNCGLN